jgi:type IV pilus assembly protein PilA
MKTKGFTLIELLIVLAIIGILVAVGAFFLGRSRNTELLRSSRSQFAQDVSRARAWTKSYSYDYQIEATVGTRTYKITPVKTAATDVPTITGTLPSGTKFNSVPSSTITYYAPLGRISASNGKYELSLNDGSLKTNVDLIGVTGLVVARAVHP